MTLSFIEAMHLSQLFAFPSVSSTFPLVPVLYSSLLLSVLHSSSTSLDLHSSLSFVLFLSPPLRLCFDLPLFMIVNKLYALLWQNEYRAIWYLSYDISKITSIRENNMPCNEFITHHSKQRDSFLLDFLSQNIRANLKCIVIWCVVVRSTCIINNKINLTESINQKLFSIKYNVEWKKCIDRLRRVLGV